MRVLEQEGEEAALKLQRGIDRGDKLLEEINRALNEIANTQLAINRITDASQGDAIKIWIFGIRFWIDTHFYK